MAGSASGQDEVNPAFWLATRAGKMAYLARSGLPALVPQKRKSFGVIFVPLINPLLNKLVRSRWLDIGLVLFCQYPAILTEKAWSITHICNERNTTRSQIGRCLWSIRVQTHCWRHRKIVFFVLSNMAHGFEDVFEIIPDLASESLEKSLALGARKIRNRD